MYVKKTFMSVVEISNKKYCTFSARGPVDFRHFWVLSAGEHARLECSVTCRRAGILKFWVGIRGLHGQQNGGRNSMPDPLNGGWEIYDCCLLFPSYHACC